MSPRSDPREHLNLRGRLYLVAGALVLAVGALILFLPKPDSGPSKQINATLGLNQSISQDGFRISTRAFFEAGKSTFSDVVAACDDSTRNFQHDGDRLMVSVLAVSMTPGSARACFAEGGFGYVDENVDALWSKQVYLRFDGPTVNTTGFYDLTIRIYHAAPEWVGTAFNVASAIVIAIGGALLGAGFGERARPPL